MNTSKDRCASIIPEELNDIHDFIIEDFLLNMWWNDCIKKYLNDIKIKCYDTGTGIYIDYFDSLYNYFAKDFISGLQDVIDYWINSEASLFVYSRDKEGFDPDSCSAVRKKQEAIFNSAKSELKVDSIVSDYSVCTTPNVNDDEMLAYLSQAEKHLGADLVFNAEQIINKCDERCHINRMYNSVWCLLNAFKEYATYYYVDGGSDITALEYKVYEKLKDAGVRVTINIKKPDKSRLILNIKQRSLKPRKKF